MPPPALGAEATQHLPEPHEKGTMFVLVGTYAADDISEVGPQGESIDRPVVLTLRLRVWMPANFTPEQFKAHKHRLSRRAPTGTKIVRTQTATKGKDGTWWCSPAAFLKRDSDNVLLTAIWSAALQRLGPDIDDVYTDLHPMGPVGWRIDETILGARADAADVQILEPVRCKHRTPDAGRMRVDGATSRHGQHAAAPAALRVTPASPGHAS
jgi:hypothetical protein